MILGGPAVFLAGRARFEYEVFARVSRSRIAAIVALLALVPVMVTRTPLASLGAAATVLLIVAVLDARRAWGVPPEQVTTPY
jgi:low temperature requirement protein LtrA